MKKFIPLDKRSKKEQKEHNDAQRVRVPFNTGTRVHPDRRPHKAKDFKENLQDDT